MTLLNVAAKLKKNYRKYMLVFIPKNWYFLTHFSLCYKSLLRIERARTKTENKKT